MERRAAGRAGSAALSPIQPARIPQRRRYLRWFCLFLGAGILLSLVLCLNRAPAVAATAPPTADEVRGAREIYHRVRSVQNSAARQVISVTWAELASVAAMGGRAAGFDRVSFLPEPGRAHLQVSQKLPLGFWLNGHAFVAADKKGRPRISARVGHLPIPAFVVHAAINAAVQVLRMRGATLLPFDQMVQQVWLDQGGMRARVELRPNSRLVRSLSSLRADSIEPERVAAHYCRLVKAQETAPDMLLAGLVSRAFAGGEGTVPDNRAIFIALSLLVAGIDAGVLPEGEGALLKQCGRARSEFSLQGRADLAKHWTVSAALSASLGTDASLALGTWKEISDSGAGGSGFSLVDLAADRSGTFSAQRGVDSSQAAALREWLARASDESLLPVTALALAEGMTEQEFRVRYTNTDSAGFAATVRRIDSELAVLMR
jgi:uncharacterized protein YfiM (DUF2279 family)